MASEILTEATRLSVMRSTVKSIFDNSDYADSDDWQDLKKDVIILMTRAYRAGQESVESQSPSPSRAPVSRK